MSPRKSEDETDGPSKEQPKTPNKDGLKEDALVDLLDSEVGKKGKIVFRCDEYHLPITVTLIFNLFARQVYLYHKTQF